MVKNLYKKLKINKHHKHIICNGIKVLSSNILNFEFFKAKLKKKFLETEYKVLIHKTIMKTKCSSVYVETVMAFILNKHFSNTIIALIYAESINL